LSDEKRFIASVESDVRNNPVRVAFVTRRTSPQVKARDEQEVMTSPYALLRFIVVLELLLIALVWISLVFNAPLEGIANPSHTPNPAKAPWYFLGLQELLHYFPPMIAGVLIPGLVVTALIIIPYFKVNIESEGFWLKSRFRKMVGFWTVVVLLCLMLGRYEVYPVLVPTILTATLMLVVASAAKQPRSGKLEWLVSKPLSFWIMTWFLIVTIVLTAIGTFFRGAGWAWVWPWQGGWS